MMLTIIWGKYYHKRCPPTRPRNMPRQNSISALFTTEGRYRKLFLTHLSDMASDFSLKWIASLNAPNGILDPAPFRLPMLSGRPMNYFG